MAAKQTTNKHIALRKAGAGIILTSFTVFVIGQTYHDVTPYTIAWQSAILSFAMYIGMRIVFRIWTSCEEIHQDSNKSTK